MTPHDDIDDIINYSIVEVDFPPHNYLSQTLMNPSDTHILLSKLTQILHKPYPIDGFYNEAHKALDIATERLDDFIEAKINLITLFAVMSNEDIKELIPNSSLS